MNASIRESIRSALAAQGIKQADVARATNITPSNLSRYLNGDSGKVPDNWQRILETAGLELTALEPELLDKLESLRNKHSTEWLMNKLEFLSQWEQEA